jgi:hypothetical protein
MTIDPDDYDLRELRRIADERRDARRSVGDDAPDAARRRRPDRFGEHGRRGRNGQSDDHAGDDVTVRPGGGDGRQDGSEHTNTRDDVFRADRMTHDLGLGTGERNGWDDSRQGRRRRPGSADRFTPDADGLGRFQFDTNVRERPRSRSGRALRENQLEQLLIYETAASGSLSKPYLTSLPVAYAAERLIFDWLEFLVLKGGFKRTMDALRYYNSVGWLTEEVEVELRDYLAGFSAEASDTADYDVEDHHLSMVYIARLSSMT